MELSAAYLRNLHLRGRDVLLPVLHTDDGEVARRARRTVRLRRGVRSRRDRVSRDEVNLLAIDAELLPETAFVRVRLSAGVGSTDFRTRNAILR
jgi:hypothetical protein